MIKSLLTFDNSVTEDLKSNVWKTVGNPVLCDTIKQFGKNSLDCHNGGIYCDDIASLGLDGDFTIEAWIYLDENSNLWNPIFCFSSEYSFNVQHNQYSVVMGGGGPYVNIATIKKSFVHVAFVVDNKNKKTCVYINGVKGLDDGRGIPTRVSCYIGYGAGGDNAGSKFQGYIDELEITSGIKYTENFIPSIAKVRLSKLSCISENNNLYTIM